MTLKEIQDKLQKEFEITDLVVQTNYIIKLGQKGTITVYFRNNEFHKMAIDGNEKDKIADCLGVNERK